MLLSQRDTSKRFCLQVCLAQGEVSTPMPASELESRPLSFCSLDLSCFFCRAGVGSESSQDGMQSSSPGGVIFGVREINLPSGTQSDSGGPLDDLASVLQLGAPIPKEP